MKIPSMLRALTRRSLPALVALASLPTLARATWSIVVTDTSTGEVCVATATCLAGFDISRAVPVIVVGRGGAAAQSWVDSSGLNRRLIRDGFLAGDSPAKILYDLEQFDSQHYTRQYGIVSLYDGDPVGFTGTGAGIAKLDVVGSFGTIRYAIQGNVLSCEQVILDTEQALIAAEGDLVTRVMAAMEVARLMGGDGRCSCSPSNPTGCGCPPPAFTHTAYTACIVVARHGDTDGNCGPGGCVQGTYFLKEVVVGYAHNNDPVITLARKVEVWRRQLRGIPDHVRTEVTPQATRLPADGLTKTKVELVLNDIDGVQVPHGGQTITVTDVSVGGPFATAGAVTDNGDGTHSFEITATTSPGDARFQIDVDQGGTLVRLYPDLEVGVDPAAELHVGHEEISATAGAEVPFVLDLGSAGASQPYLLLMGNSGTHPGTSYGGLTIPLNNDRFLQWSLTSPNVPFWIGNHGALDASGRAGSLLTCDPGAYAPFVGGRFDFCVLLPNYVTAPDGFDVAP